MEILKPRRHQLETIIGHDVLKKLIRRFSNEKSVPHAFLFYGPRGAGKESFAYAYAKFLNCQEKPGAILCRCNACRKIEHSSYLDMRVLEPEGGGRTIRIDKIRQIQDWAYLTPVEADKKILLLIEADRMSLSAANSLLKILEEPPKHLVIILVTHDVSRLLPTIRSRCMTFRFSPLSEEELTQWIKNIDPELSEEEARTVALLSEGRPGRAAHILEGKYLKRRETLISELALFNEKGFPSIFRVADRIAAAYDNLGMTLDELLSWYRDLLISRLVPDDPSLLVHSDKKEHLSETADSFSILGLYEALDNIISRQHLASRIIHKHLALMVLLTDIGISQKK